MGSLGSINGFDIQVVKSTNLTEVPVPNSLEYLVLPNTDHILIVKWTALAGWETPEVRPFGDISISPTASCLHYATECFEGLKVYRGYDGKLRLFRPDLNGDRLAMSAERGSLPQFPPDKLKDMISRLLQIDGPRWLPKDRPGHFLYIRPAIIGTGKKLGYKIPDEALLLVIATPYKNLSQTESGKPCGLKLLTSSPDSTRAWPGGFGFAKLGANYGPSLEAHRAATDQGFDQILWLFGPKRTVTEAGASNLFLVWTSEITGRNELITPSLDSKLILNGITRKSVLDLSRSRFTESVSGLPPLEVVERDVTFDEIEQAWRQGRLIEAFVTGTAYFITAVTTIRNEGVDMDIALANDKGLSYRAQIKTWLENIQFGNEDHIWAHVIEGEESS